MKRILSSIISCLLIINIVGMIQFVSAADEAGTLILDNFDKYANQAALNENYTNYAYGGTKAEIILNTDTANCKGKSGKSLKLTAKEDKDGVGAVVMSNLNFLDGYEGVTLWLKNASAEKVGFYILLRYTAMPKKNSPYYLMADGKSSYTKHTTQDKTYYNIDIDPGFSGQIRIPASSFTSPVSEDIFSPIVIQTIVKPELLAQYTMYFDSIGLYGETTTSKPTPTKPAGKPTPTTAVKPGDPTPTLGPVVETKGNRTVVLDDMNSYMDSAAATDAGYAVNAYAASSATTKITLNKDPANSFEGNSISVFLGDDKRNPSLFNSFETIEGAGGFEFWFSNPNKNPVAIYTSFNWGPFIKASSKYYVKDFSVGNKDYVERTTGDKQYFNMEFAPGFKGFIRLPFSSSSAPVDSLANTSIQLWSLGDATPGNGNTYYFDNISLYGLEDKGIAPEDKIAKIEITSQAYGFIPRIEGDNYEVMLTAKGLNVNNEPRDSNTFNWTLKKEYKGVKLTSAGVMTIDGTAELGEIAIVCKTIYKANGESGKSLEFKINLTPGEKLLTSTDSTKTPPKASSKDYFKS